MDVSVDPQLAAVRLPFSLSQQEVWLDQRAWPGSTHLNIGGAGYIDGPFDPERFRKALDRMVAESEALRLVPLPEGGQYLLDAYEASLQIVDISMAPDPLEAMRQWWQARISEPFEAGKPPWRFALLRYSDTLHGLSIQFHHLIMDGWGTSQVMQRWAELYNALESGDELPALQAPAYRLFIDESRAYRDSPAFDKDGEFWRAQMPALPHPLFERRFLASGSACLPPAHVVKQGLSRCDYGHWRQLASTLGTTLFGFLAAAIAAYFARLGERSEVVLGLPSLNRSGKRYRETLGMFVGVFPLVVKFRPGMTVRTLCEEVALSLKAAVRHQRFPVSELGRCLGVIRQHRDSIFDVLFSYERQDYDLRFGAGHSFGACQIFSGLARYPMGITLCEFQSEQDVELTLEAHPEYFARQEVECLGRRLHHWVHQMASDPEIQLDRLQLLLPDEMAGLLDSGQGDDHSPEPFILQFERWARHVPAAPALIWDGGEIDYARLDRWADQLALALPAAGRNRIVALAMERSPEMVAAMLAIAKSGAAFLPLDPDAPVARLRDILADSGAIALLTQARLYDRLSPLHACVVSIDGRPMPESAVMPVRPAESIALGDLAYVLFTSGSTGRPKGVMLEHGALARRLAWISKAYGVTPDDRTGQCSQATFDPSLIEFFLPLVNGASIALPSPGRLSPMALGPFVARHQVSILALVPSTLRGLLDSLPECSGHRLRVACCGGERLSPELASRFVNETGACLFNVYGPTETAIFATAWPCLPPMEASVLPVGQAIDGSRIYILDAQRRPLPAGTIGEIYIGGPVVARGYLNRPELDDGSFFADPNLTGGRMYRSGDRGWQAGDGTLHFVGRLDRQIKLRGYRIELGEIESVLAEMPGIRQAAVKLMESDGGGRIHAWVCGGGELAADQIRRYLSARLPDYMLPSGISCLSEMPFNVTGKVAYNLLPEPDGKGCFHVARLPATDWERALLVLWRRILKREDLGVADNFFDLGGDSLAAVEIMAGIENLAGYSLPFFVLIEHPTVEQLAVKLEESGGTPREDGSLLCLGGRRGSVPLYFAASGQGDLIRFKRLADELMGDYQFFMLQPPQSGCFGSIQELAQIYAARIVEHGRRDIVLAGFSVGGVAALETARILQARGWPVRDLCLVDVLYPGRVLRSAVLWRMMGWMARHLHASELNLNGRHLGGLFNDSGLIAQINAMADYRVEPYRARLHLIRSSGLMKWDRWIFRQWQRMLPAVASDVVVPGLHGSIFEPLCIGLLGDAIRGILDAR